LDINGFFKMELVLEKFVVYFIVAAFCIGIVILYLRLKKRQSLVVEGKIQKAKEEGIHEPISLHPVVSQEICIGSGACIVACPEKDILGIRDGKATIVNASECVGHGACFHACPVEAIILCIGTEKRGVELPHVSQKFETNVPGIYIAGELGGMGLIKNSVEQGKQAVENIVQSGRRSDNGVLDLVIVGAGPAGISASLTAKKNNLKFQTLEQDTLGGTVYSFPRAKVVMTSPMSLPLYGKVKLYETSKSELLTIWEDVLNKNQIEIKENAKVELIISENEHFKVRLLTGEELSAKNVLLAIGRRGTPRKLNVPGEDLEKVAYRLLEPELISNKNIVVVGGGDSAIESALLLADQNTVMLSYRSAAFKRLKPKNREKINAAMEAGLVDVRFNSNLISIGKDYIELSFSENSEKLKFKNDLVYIFAGGELPTQFLQKAGIRITKKFGDAILTHKKN
jgi:thioredoxin reductase